MMKELIENDAEHSDLTEQLDWYILSIVNPDGYAYTISNDRLWRKTRWVTYLKLPIRVELAYINALLFEHAGIYLISSIMKFLKRVLIIYSIYMHMY